MSEDQELKPCPFCGGKAELVFHGGPENIEVCCSNMNSCAIGQLGVYRDTREEAIKAWNRRASVAPKGREWKPEDRIRIFLESNVTFEFQSLHSKVQAALRSLGQEDGK